MNRIATARQLLKLARELTADSGDVPVYFNAGDFFRATGNNWLSQEQEKVGMDILENVTMTLWTGFDDQVRNAIRRNPFMKRKLVEAGMVLLDK